jgi:hypothetical protein
MKQLNEKKTRHFAFLRSGGALLAVLMMAGLPALAQDANVQIIHNSPDPAAAVVDIYLGSDLAVPDFGFRQATGIIPLPANTDLMVGVAPGNSMSSADVIAWFPVNLPAGDYVVIAAGMISGGLPANPEGKDTAFNLYVNSLQTADSGAGVSLLAFHGAPDAPTVDINAVGVGNLVGSLGFGDFAGYLSVPAANYTLEITPAGAPATVVARFAANLEGLSGGAAVVFASGFLGAKLDAFGLYAALPSGDVVPLQPVAVANEEVSLGRLKATYMN